MSQKSSPEFAVNSNYSIFLKTLNSKNLFWADLNCCVFAMPQASADTMNFFHLEHLLVNSRVNSLMEVKNAIRLHNIFYILKNKSISGIVYGVV